MFYFLIPNCKSQVLWHRIWIAVMWQVANWQELLKAALAALTIYAQITTLDSPIKKTGWINLIALLLVNLATLERGTVKKNPESDQFIGGGGELKRGQELFTLMQTVQFRCPLSHNWPTLSWFLVCPAMSELWHFFMGSTFLLWLEQRV